MKKGEVPVPEEIRAIIQDDEELKLLFTDWAYTTIAIADRLCEKGKKPKEIVDFFRLLIRIRYFE